MSAITGMWCLDRGCERCEAKSGTKLIYRWTPKRVETEEMFTGRPLNPPRVIPGSWHVRRRCTSEIACEERRSRAALMRRRRQGRFELDGAGAPDAPYGQCRWCGEELTGDNGQRRNYCYADREGRPCRQHAYMAITHKARTVVRYRDFRDIGRLVCADCGEVCEEPEPRYERNRLAVHSEHTVLKRWEADHEVPLEDGGEHVPDNLRCRCVPCHRRKTGRENAARRAKITA